jgi:hypothetical protein
LEKNYLNRTIESGSITDNDLIKITTLGRYHINILISEFQYLDATIIDTPILDDQTREKIFDVSDIQERLKRTELFLKYLIKSIETITDSEIKSFWHKVSLSAFEKIEEIKNRNER